MWIMKITPGDSHKTKQYFETLFVKDDCKNVIGYIKEQGKIEEFKARWDRIKIGDLVVVMQGMSKIFGVVEITSNSWDVDKDDVDWAADWFYHRRNARLIKYFKEPIISEFPTNSDTIIEYSGAGAIKICDMVWDKIKADYYSIKEKENMEDIKALLEYKKQIILQGPPGTGKTRLAKMMAEDMTKANKLSSPLDKINNYFETYKPDDSRLELREKIKDLVSTFQEKFKKEELKNLSLENYALGTDDKDGFCYWIEYLLTDTGRYNGQADKGKIYWKNDEQRYVKSGFLKTIEDDNEAMKKMAELLDNMVNHTHQQGVNYPIGKGFVLKVLNAYFPEKYFPINNEKCLSNALKLLGENPIGLNYIQKNLRLQEIFLEKKQKYNADLTNNEFMYFLFTYDLNGEIKFENTELIVEGKYKIVQFHPSYSYEDFVRGISAKSNEKGIYYTVEDKIIAQLAEEAYKNTNGKYILIIDEINRANLSSVLGELIYALEYRFNHKKENYKEAEVESLYDKSNDTTEPDRKIKLPDNLLIIGTMNTADRSVGHIDYAIKRRFAFVNVLPQIEPVHPLIKDIFIKVSNLFVKNFDGLTIPKNLESSDSLATDFRPEDIWIGHSYFICKKENSNENVEDDKAKPILNMKLQYEIIPLLKEYIKDGILLETEQVKNVMHELISKNFS